MESIELETPSKVLANIFAKLSVNDDTIIGDENVRNENENNYGGEYCDSHSNATQVHDTQTPKKFKTTIEVSNCFGTFQKESEKIIENLENDSINASMKSVGEYNSHLEVENSERNHKTYENDDKINSISEHEYSIEDLDILKMIAYKREPSNSSLSRMSLYRQFDPLVGVQSPLMNSDKTIKVTNLEPHMRQMNAVPESDSFDDSIDAETSMSHTIIDNEFLDIVNQLLDDLKTERNELIEKNNILTQEKERAKMTINSLNAQMEQKTHKILELTKMLNELIAKVGK